MLVGFTVGNFRSFNQPERFSMEAGRTRNHSERVTYTASSKILKFKAIYGANASGKSNIVHAMDFMQYILLDGVPSGLSSECCRMYDDNINRPSFFEIELILDGIRYTYGFKILLANACITKEWLKEKRGKAEERLVFSRDVQAGTYTVDLYVNNSTLNDRLRIYADDVRNDGSALFLHVMNSNKDSLYNDRSPIKAYQTVYRWFKDSFIVTYPDDTITQYRYFFDSQNSASVADLLSRFDTAISDIRLCDEPIEKIVALFPKDMLKDIRKSLSERQQHIKEIGGDEQAAIVLRNRTTHDMYKFEFDGSDITCQTIKFNHMHSSSLFSLSDESDGTNRLLDLLEVLLSTAPNTVYIIDEVSRCLHPQLTKAFIKNFLDLAKERNIQLIVTTHEANLMDLDLLRQDEVCFIEKRHEDGTSRIYSLDDLGARFDKRIQKAYLKGDYGAVPRIDV